MIARIAKRFRWRLMAESKSKVCVWMFQMGCLGLFGLSLGKGWKYFVVFVSSVCVIRMMGIIRLWAGMLLVWDGLSPSEVLPALHSLPTGILAPICHTRHLCVWAVYCSEDAVPHFGVWFLHFQPVAAGFLCVCARETQCFGFGRSSLEEKKCSHLCGFDFLSYPISSLYIHKYRTSINTPNWKSDVCSSLFMLSWRDTCVSCPAAFLK